MPHSLSTLSHRRRRTFLLRFYHSTTPLPGSSSTKPPPYHLHCCSQNPNVPFLHRRKPPPPSPEAAPATAQDGVPIAEASLQSRSYSGGSISSLLRRVASEEGIGNTRGRLR
ncbi:hypothetical protein RIF29_18796 [Crotalaria pallida]|uniref:Uncharacterized protein n=1 Tax=Crotalaria pallida TaxID=3830 RepID=A0AAN9I5V8_CROPI